MAEKIEVTHVPESEYLQSLESRSDLKEIGWQMNVPLFSHPEIQMAMGSIGVTFSRSHKVVMRFFHDAMNKRLLGCAYFPMTVEGPYGCVHGGCIATALDEIFGFLLVREVGMGLVTANLTVNYRSLIPLGSVVAFEAQLTKVEGRKLRVSGRLFDPSGGKTYDDGHALFLTRSQKGNVIPWSTMVSVFGPQSQLTPQQIIQLIRKRRSAVEGGSSPQAKLWQFLPTLRTAHDAMGQSTSKKKKGSLIKQQQIASQISTKSLLAEKYLPKHNHFTQTAAPASFDESLGELNKFPNEVLLVVVKYLAVKDIATLSITSKGLNYILSDEILWTTLSKSIRWLSSASNDPICCTKAEFQRRWKAEAPSRRLQSLQAERDAIQSELQQTTRKMEELQRHEHEMLKLGNGIFLGVLLVVVFLLRLVWLVRAVVTFPARAIWWWYDYRCRDRFCFPLRAIHFFVAGCCEFVFMAFLLFLGILCYRTSKYSNPLVRSLIVIPELPKVRQQKEALSSKLYWISERCTAMESLVAWNARGKADKRK